MNSRHPTTHTNGGFLPAGPVLSQWRSGVSGTISRGGLGGPTNHKKGTIVFKYQAVLIVFGILTVAAAFRLLGALLEIALGRSWS